MTANLSLTYGSLNLTASPYLIEFGADFGAPQNVTQVLAFLLQDGEVEMTDRTSNRTIQFNVLIEGPDLAALADAEADLMAEANKPLNLLTVDPGDFGPATVYETYRAQVTWLRDDDMDMQRLRRYSVTIKAMPAGRSATEVVTAALAPSGTTTTLVDNGSATTGWTGAINGSSTSPSVVSGAVKVTNGAAVYGNVTATLTLTTAITTSSTKYLMIDWKPETPAYGSIRAFGDGIELSQVAQAVSPTAGFVRTWFFVAASSIAVLRLDSTTTISTDDRQPWIRSLYVDNINRTDVKPSFGGTGRQLLRSIDITGSARATGSLAIEHSTNALGDVIAYFYPDSDLFAAYTPPLRQYRVAGGATVTSDATMVSGARDLITGGTSTYDIPAANLVPGLHLLGLRMQVSGGNTGTITWTASTRINGTAVGPVQTGTFLANPLAAGAGYVNYTFARIALPTIDVDRSATNAVVRITLAVSSAGGANLDEAWLFNSGIGQLVMVSCDDQAAASGGPARRVFLEPATTSNPRPTIRIGHAADRSDSFYPVNRPGASGIVGVASWQSPVFVPPRVRVFTVASNAADVSVTLNYFPRWALNAAS